MKKKLTILLTVVIFLIILAPNSYGMGNVDSPTGVQASIEGYGTSDDEKTKDSNLHINMDYRPSSNLFIERTISSIHDIGRGYVNIQASTKTFTTIDRLSLTVHLEVWKGSSWRVVESWSANERFKNTINFNTVASVNSGESYRVRTSHVAVHNGVVESKQTVTSYITIP